MTKHKKHGSREYRAWLRIKTVCYNENNSNFKAYGARGIRMDASWKSSFSQFYSAMGDCPEGCTGIELINMNSDFEKFNCRWVGPNGRRPLKDMPNQKNRKSRKRYKQPKKIVLTIESGYFEFIQRQAIEKSRQAGKPITAVELIKQLMIEHFPMPVQGDLFETNELRK